MYKPILGLEIHVELKTKTKMFCSCLNDPDERHPNINVCPICLAHPGTLPVINKKAVEAVLKLGAVLSGEISQASKFDRKNYFYPDLPKGYQISQYDKPLVLGGELNGVKLRRVHLEEDAARLLHRDGESLVDFNRASIPLMELVTEPDIKNGEEAVKFAQELRLVLRYLGISDADMERGQMRVEANISLQRKLEIQNPKSETNPKSQIQNSKLGTKVEIKNLNSFRAVGEAIDYEIKRQTEILEKGEKIVHETRGWNEAKKITVSQRSKEEAHDYRYFPEPDLPPMDVSRFDLEKIKSEIPELPAQKRERFAREYGLKPEQLEIFIEDRGFGDYFEESVSELLSEIGEENKFQNIQVLFNYLASDIRGLINELKIDIGNLNISPENFADLVVLVVKGDISSRIAKDLIKEMRTDGLDPRQIIKEKGWSQISDEQEIKKTVLEVINGNPSVVEDYKKGKQRVIQFLIGQAMSKLGGRGKPEIIEKLFKESIDKNKINQ
jgi:aspartyl-tRNA(Asn)/glutamyl-tRNA(Gln) amidotransferase subunit B